MKKTLIALAAVTCTAAFAQSTVTIDGQMDMGIVKPLGATGARLDASNGNNKIRFRGSEDLGGGLKANFIAETRFSPESGGQDGSGNTRPLWQGETTVGLSGGFGSVKIGRSLTALQLSVNNTDPWVTAHQSSTAVLAGSYATDPVANPDGGGLGRTDAITYVSPNLGGLTAAASFGFKQSAAQAGNGNTKQAENLISVWLGYANGPIYVGGGYEQNRRDDDVTAVLATYDFGAFKLGAGFSKTGTAAADYNAWNVMGTMPMGAATLKLGYGVIKNKTTNAHTTKKLGIGVDYALSKRTTMYANFGRNSVLTTNKAGFDVGLKHAF